MAALVENRASGKYPGTMMPAPPDSPHFSPPAAKPDFSFEEAVFARGFKQVCGVDEVGRGPLAGPVVAAAAVLDPSNLPDGLNDSKKLTEKRREILFMELMECCTFSIASVSASTIDRINIRAASLLAMTQAVSQLEQVPDHALIDGNALPANLPCEATTIIKGDSRSLSIAAASIIAKVTRDRMMETATLKFDGYGFEKHKGYGTKFHMDALKTLGPCKLHRMTFAPVRDAAR